ncbi:type I restriction enzyme, S subunit [Spirosomataceae bacterium TFI 002]|nr:type I restriction enzyme, S subunit [Spirosomataceae bacterium TFI 002]
MKNIASTVKHIINQLPPSWEIKCFEDVAEIDGSNLTNSTALNYEFEYISLSDIDSKNNRFSTSKQVFGRAPSRARRVVKQGDILMSTVRPNLKAFYLIKTEVKNLIASTGFALITAKACSKEYLYQFLFSSEIERQLHKLLVGSNYPAINSSDVRKLKISLPPLPEQKAIASILATCDTQINTLEKLICQKEQQKKWLMQNLLTEKIKLVTNQKKWVERKVSQLFTQKRRYINWDEKEQYNLISIKRRNGGIFYRPPLHGYDIGVKKLKEVKVSDFVISKRQASHGAWAVVEKKFDKAHISDEYVSLEVLPQFLDPSFWKWYCQLPILTHCANIDSNGVHIEKSIFDYSLFKKRKIAIPESLEEQQAIAQVLTTAEKEISLLKAKTEKLRESKKGLMQQLLTGKKRVKI